MAERVRITDPDKPSSPVRLRYEQIEIACIYVDSGTRLPLDQRHIDRLADSIKHVSLLEPIVLRRVGDRVELIGGNSRLQACRKLGHSTIAAVVQDGATPAHWNELAEIDENLIRRDLSPAERALLISRRKAIYESIHPETKHGAAGRGRNRDRDLRSFSMETAALTGRSKGDIAKDATRAKKLGEYDIERIAGTSLDTGSEIDALCKMSKHEREALIVRAEAGETVTARPEKTDPPKLAELIDIAIQLKVALRDADVNEKNAFLCEDIAREVVALLTEHEPVGLARHTPSVH